MNMVWDNKPANLKNCATYLLAEYSNGKYTIMEDTFEWCAVNGFYALGQKKHIDVDNPENVVWYNIAPIEKQLPTKELKMETIYDVE